MLKNISKYIFASIAVFIFAILLLNYILLPLIANKNKEIYLSDVRGLDLEEAKLLLENFNLKKQNTSLMYVSVKDNNIERALREFKKRVKNSNLLKELREREYYEKKSARNRKMKKMRALKIKTLQKD